jgi:hypothetical protein
MEEDMADLYGYGKHFIALFVLLLLFHVVWRSSGFRQLLNTIKWFRWFYIFGMVQTLSSLLAAAALAYILAAGSSHADFATLAFAVFLFGASLFMILDEAMYLGGRWLTKRLGGNNWVKQIDYIYLLMGSFGIAGSIDRLSFVEQKVEFVSDYGPLLVAAAIAIRLVKTRVEINGWDKTEGKAPYDGNRAAETAGKTIASGN